MRISKTKILYFGIHICAMGLLLLPYWKAVSPFQFSDGIPMLGRVDELKNGVCTVPQYFFKAHGNSIHTLVYLLAFLDDIFTGQSMLLLKLGVFIGMFATGLLAAWIFWREEPNSGIRLILVWMSEVMIVGTYNFDLYLPFQVVLTLSRPIYIVVLYRLAKKLISKEIDNKGWYCLLVLSTVTALFHGMGMMFAGAVFYIHIVSRQKKAAIAKSAVPLVAYHILQIYFNSGYGEVTTAKFFLVKYFKEFILGLFAYYGGILYQLFGCSKATAIFIGGVVFFIVFGLLLYFFLKGILGEKMPGKYEIQSSRGLLAVALLGMSFLASIGASAFVAARIDLVASISNDPLEMVLGTGRYLCFSITPYIAALYIVLTQIRHEHKLQKYLLTIGAIGLLLLCISNNYLISQKTAEENSQLDANAVALLCGMDYSSKEMERAYGYFADDWYWSVRIPKVYENLKRDRRYIWNGLADLGSFLDGFDSLKKMGATRIDYFKCSDSDFTGIQLRCPDKPRLRYMPVTDETGKVAGYVYVYRRKGFYAENGHLYYDGNYILRGYIKTAYQDKGTLYAINQTTNAPVSIEGRVCTGCLQLANLTDANWTSGIALDQCCLLAEYTDERLDLVANADLVGDGNRTVYEIESYDCVDGWIRIFIKGNDKADHLRYPNYVYFYR